MINNGATFDGKSWIFDGASYIDSNYNPSIDGVSYTLNDALTGAYVHTKSPTDGNIFGVRSDFFNNNCFILEQGSNGRYLSRINANENNIYSEIPTSKTLLTTLSLSSTIEEMFKDGVSLGQKTVTKTGVPSLSIFIELLHATRKHTQYHYRPENNPYMYQDANLLHRFLPEHHRNESY